MQLITAVDWSPDATAVRIIDQRCLPGTFVERADCIARILDMKYYLLLPSLSYVGSRLDTGQWDQVLRSVSGDRAYRWLNAGQIDARGIVEFLVLDDRFPRGSTAAKGKAMP